MDRFEHGPKLINLVVFTLLITLLGNVSVRAQPDRESTFVIEGKDRQSARSVFEYESDTTVKSFSVGTTDRPDAPSPEPIEDPDLHKDRLFSDSPENRAETNTAVNEYGTLEMLAVGLGVVAVLLSI